MSIYQGLAVVSTYDPKTSVVKEAVASADFAVENEGNFTNVFHYSDIIVGDVSGILSFIDNPTPLYNSYIGGLLFTVSARFNETSVIILLNYTGVRDGKQVSGISSFQVSNNKSISKSLKKLISKKL